MSILHGTYEVSSPLETREAFERIERLLAHENVEYIAKGLRVASTSTPIIFLGLQPKLYTRKNWVGLNPFAFITSVDVQCESAEGAPARIKVCINRRRSILHVVFWGACGALMARVMPQPAGVILFVMMVLVAWLCIVKYLGGRLVKREILNELGVHR